MAFTVYLAGVSTPSAATTATAAITSPVAAGDTIVVSCGTGGSTGENVDAISDTKGNVYDIAGTTITGQGTWQFTCQDATALTTSDSVTVTFSSAVSIKNLVVIGVHGAAASGVLADAYAQAGGTGTALSVTTGTPVSASEVAIATFSNGNSGLAPVLAGGWTQAGQVHVTNDAWLTVAYHVLSSASPVTASATISNSVGWSAQVLTLAAQGVLPARWVQSVAGAPTQAQFQVVSKLAGATSVRLKVASNQALTENVTWAPAQIPDIYGYVRHTAANLAPFTTWYYQVADTPSGGGETLLGPAGKCKTLPPSGSPQSFTVAVVSCVEQQVTDVSAVDDWVAWDADLNIYTGDFDYADTQSLDGRIQIQIYETQIATVGSGSAASQAAGYPSSYSQMAGQAWGYYCRSDHESGPDNGDSGPISAVPWIPVNITAAQQVFPFGTLGDISGSDPPIGLWQAWTAGRIRFINIDIRNTDRSPGAMTDGPSKTMLGAAQLAWFYDQLTQPEPLKIIIEDTQWAGPSSTILDEEGQDKWWNYSTERSAIISFLEDNAAQVQNLLWIHGDSHLVGVMTAADNTWGGFPVYCAAPMNNVGGGLNNQVWASFYDNSGGNCRLYGRLTITDNGSVITTEFQGWDASAAEARVSQTDTFSCPAVTAALPGTFGALIT